MHGDTPVAHPGSDLRYPRGMRRFPLLLAALLLTVLSPVTAGAHGINGHIHVTAWAIEALPPGPVRALLMDPQVRDAALIGAAFPDSGYAVDHAYGELAHWPPFVEACIQRLEPPFETLDEQRAAAFVMGLAAHGLQDEIFDSLFLYQIQKHDNAGQDAADPGTDAFLFTDGYLHHRPAVWFPFPLIAGALADAHDEEVTADVISLGLGRIKTLVIDGAAGVAAVFDPRYRPELPWTAAHYVDPDIPGSLAAEIPATRAYLDALWARMHGEFAMAALVGHPYPSADRRLRGLVANDVDSWVTLVFGAGVRVGSLNMARVELVDAAGVPVPFELRANRWSNGNPNAMTRLAVLRPTVDLVADAEYTVRVLPGLELVDGSLLDVDWAYTFRTRCADAAACPPPDTGFAPLAPEPPPAPDMGLADMGAADMGPADMGAVDMGAVDAQVLTDMAAPVDAAQPTDMTAPDATNDAPGTTGGSSGCTVSRTPSSGGWALLFLLACRSRRRPDGSIAPAQVYPAKV